MKPYIHIMKLLIEIYLYLFSRGQSQIFPKQKIQLRSDFRIKILQRVILEKMFHEPMYWLSRYFTTLQEFNLCNLWIQYYEFAHSLMSHSCTNWWQPFWPYEKRYYQRKLAYICAYLCSSVSFLSIASHGAAIKVDHIKFTKMPEHDKRIIGVK